MRRIVRPFVKEFKSRSAKAAAGRLGPLDEAAPESKPAFLDLATFAPRVVEREAQHDDSYEAAMKAADLVFGKKAEPVTAEAAPGATTTGRVLPSLIEIVAPQPEPEEPVRRGPGRPRGVKKAVEPKIEAEIEALAPAPARARPGRPRKAVEAAPAPKPRRAPTPTPTAIVAQPQAPIAIPVSAIPVAAESETNGRRIRRPIQLRWVLNKELRAGERWKRRLPEAAR
ncbi:hypothetical protein EDE12_107159 [Methylosinus sp. sav-2]|uniref:hypothetical protein n=1 Tax=Methylosinus sp. sav-2 TaxID=2485168 RepID=UPI00047C2A9C|nr:hypothetical protein [Methylosinus sp. sav-2]TDX63517.1 hypothetical protein EDE12_107159 [Methylosinus sp. sav-2]